MNTLRPLVMTAIGALALSACATGQSSSFATRVGSGDGGFASAQGEAETGQTFNAEPDLLASSGNVLLPGAFNGPTGSPQLLAGLSPLTGVLDPLTGAVGSAAGGGSVLNALVGGNVALTLDSATGPSVTADVDANATIAGLQGSPLGGALSPVTSALSPVTNAATGAGALGGAPLANVSARGVSVAGQPLLSLGSTGSVLNGAGSAAGAATAGAGAVAASVAPAASTIVNAAGQAVGTVTTPPTPGSSPAPTAVAGLGNLNALLPRRR